MHPPRRNKATFQVNLADRVAEWLLAHCPFLTVTILMLLVVGPTFGVSRPIVVLAGAVVADVVLSVIRRRRTVRRHRPPVRYQLTPPSNATV